jgi:hypothetical protein
VNSPKASRIEVFQVLNWNAGMETKSSSVRPDFASCPVEFSRSGTRQTSGDSKTTSDLKIVVDEVEPTAGHANSNEDGCYVIELNNQHILYPTYWC